MNPEIENKLDKAFNRPLSHPHLESPPRMEGTMPKQQWQPVNCLINNNLREIHVDEIAITIGQDNTALATFAWPETGRYAVCQLVDVDVDTPQPQPMEMPDAGMIRVMRGALRSKRINIEMSDLSKDHEKRELAQVDAALTWLDGLAKE